MDHKICDVFFLKLTKEKQNWYIIENINRVASNSLENKSQGVYKDE